MKIIHRAKCPASEGGPACECGAVGVELFGREAQALSIIEWARSVRRSWEAAPESLRAHMAGALHSGVTLLHHDIEQLRHAVAAFDEEP